ncbi:hypothetical protein MYX07_05955 [Patescibacteria group bacterium AH-259-L07]|nr:hypothetical protein [Patescibacteria group bacterium AH-259-L07]
MNNIQHGRIKSCLLRLVKDKASHPKRNAGSFWRSRFQKQGRFKALQAILPLSFRGRPFLSLRGVLTKSGRRSNLLRHLLVIARLVPSASEGTRRGNLLRSSLSLRGAERFPFFVIARSKRSERRGNLIPLKTVYVSLLALIFILVSIWGVQLAYGAQTQVKGKQILPDFKAQNIFTTGKVGIGTTGPDTQLHVLGGVCIDTDGVCIDPGPGNLYVEGTITSLINTDVTNAANISSGEFGSNVGVGDYYFPANVGIGTTAPSEKLHIQDGKALIVTNTNDGGTFALTFRKSRNPTDGAHTIVQDGDNLGEIQFYGSDGNSWEQAALILAEVDGSPGDGDMPGRLSFWTSPDGTASALQRMTIDSAGNVGIGTTSPAYTLDVRAPATGTSVGNKTAAIFEQARNGNATQDTGWIGGAFGGGNSLGNRVVLGSDSSGATIGGHNNALNGWADLYVGQSSVNTIFNGNVGIGTPNPDNKLQITGINASGTAGPNLRFTTSADTYPTMQILNYTHDDQSINFDAYYDGTWHSSDTGSNFQIVKRTDKLWIGYDSGIAPGSAPTWNNDGIVLNTSGNVGIGDSTPTEAKLVVNGDLSVGGSLIVDTTGDLQMDNLEDADFDEAGSSGALVLGVAEANSNSCDTVCSNHGLTCSRVFIFSGGGFGNLGAPCNAINTDRRLCWCQ